VRDDARLTPSEVEEQKARNPIMPDKNSKTAVDVVPLIKPDLTKAKYLQSNHTTPLDSVNQSVSSQ
jgi:hypothetical protein